MERKTRQVSHGLGSLSVLYWTVDAFKIIILSEVSQTEKDKYHDIAYLWNLKK